MEGKEWIWDNGILGEHQIARIEKQIKQSRKNLKNTQIDAFETFMSKL
jgi:hypothetical protein